MKKVEKKYRFGQMNSVEDFSRILGADGLDFPVSQDLSVLAQPFELYGKTVPNRLGIQPLEGFDGLPSGAPSDLIFRRYHRYASGGAGLIWYESIAISDDGRCNPLQMVINEETVGEIGRLIRESDQAAWESMGHKPYNVLQLTHSGRRSNNKNWEPTPLAVCENPYMDDHTSIDGSCGKIEIATDEKIEEIIEGFIHGAELAAEAGFDCVDVKVCHEYILRELLSAFTRPGKFGGSFENRFRLLKNGIRAAKVYEDDHFMVTARLGIYDGYAYPWGFGVSPESGTTPDLTEPKRLVRELHDELGVDMVDLTMGNPYATTHVTRPFDFGKYEPDEHPLVGLARMIHGIGEVKKAVPEMTVWASAPSYLRAYADLFTAGAVEEGLCDGMLFGRMAFADPDFANEILKNGRIDPKHVCLTCGKCGDLIRAHKPTGCVIRDAKTFMPFYKEFLEIKKTQPANFRG